MTQKHRFLPALLFASLLLINLSSLGAVGGSNEICDINALPKPVRELLAKEYPEWTTWTLPEDSRFWGNWMKEHSGQCPGLASGHFEDKKYLSHAMMLVPREPEKPGYRLLVLNEKEGQGGKHQRRVIWEDDKEMASKVIYGYIYAVPPGKYWDFAKTKSVRLDLEGFVYRLIVGKETVLFYWKHGQYQDLIIGE